MKPSLPNAVMPAALPLSGLAGRPSLAMPAPPARGRLRLSLALCAALQLFGGTCIAADGAGAADGAEKTGTAVAAGNTLRVENANGVLYIFFLPDGRYEWTGANGQRASGNWHVRDESVCVEQTAPPPPPAMNSLHCMPLSGRAAGDAWSGFSKRNGPIQYRLLPGRQGPTAAECLRMLTICSDGEAR